MPSIDEAFKAWAAIAESAVQLVDYSERGIKAGAVDACDVKAAGASLERLRIWRDYACSQSIIWRECVVSGAVIDGADWPPVDEVG